MPKVVNSWFIRKNNAVVGPYTAGLVRRYVLLGRLSQDDEASFDKSEWRKIQEISDLYPDIMRANLNDPIAKERLLAAQRWADERTVKERRAAALEEVCGPYQRGKDRRSPEAPDLVIYREARNWRDEAQKSSFVSSASFNNKKIIAIVSISILGIFAIGINFSPTSVIDNPIDCSASAAPGVNWSNCRLEGKSLFDVQLQNANMRSVNLTGASLQRSDLTTADLSFAVLTMVDLSDAKLIKTILVGADFRNAKLENADLTEADFSYADLSGANLQGAQLQGVKFDKAIWIDSSVCAQGSVGQCLAMPDGS